MWVADLRSGARRRLIGGRGWIRAIAASPDGRWVVFERFDSGNDGFWVAARDSGELRQIERGAYYVERAWSPNARWLAYASEGLYVVEAGVWTPRQLVRGQASSLSWSRNSRWLAAAINGDIYRIDVVKKIVRRVTRGGQAYSPVLSPDGTRVAWLPGLKLTVSAVNGKIIRRFGERSVCDYDPRWSPSGRRIGYDHDPECDRGGSLAVVTLQGDRTRFARAIRWQWRPHAR